VAATILVCDEGDEIVDSLSCCLKQDGYRILLARTGRQALCLAVDFQPDLILLDVSLPGLGGWETFEWLRQVSSAPKIVMMAPTDQASREYSKQMGMQDQIITKPFQFTDLHKGINYALEIQSDPIEARKTLPEASTRTEVFGLSRSHNGLLLAGHPLHRLPPRQSPFLVIIPAYNEQNSIGHVVRNILEHLPPADVLVINDGSLDNTTKMAMEAGADVLELPFNLGIGGAVQAGLKFADARGYPFVIRLDGDGQHDPKYISELLSMALRGEHNAVFGSRFISGRLDYRPSLPRLIGIRLFSFMVSAIVGQRVSDATSGMMVLDRKAISVLARNLPQDYPEVEARIILHKAGLKSIEVPIEMRTRFSGVSSINAIRALYYAVKVSLATILSSLRVDSHRSKED
jgi:DNA-binding response OmpR family regulator